MKVKCPYCGKRLTIPERYENKEVKCPACGKSFRFNQQSIEKIKAESKNVRALRESSKRFNQQKSPPDKESSFWDKANDFLNFRTMVFPRIMIILSVLVTAICAVSIICSFFIEKLGTYFVFINLAMIVGFRLWAEWLVILFRINETLTDIYHKLNTNNKKDDEK